MLNLLISKIRYGWFTLSRYKRTACRIGVYFIAAVLLISGISKILDPMPLIETLKAFTKLPEEYLILAATILPVIEISLGILLVLKIKPKPVMLGTLILFAAFLAFSIYGTIMGMTNDCGCFGSLVESQIGWGMIIRNLGFIIVAALIITYNKVYIAKNSGRSINNILVIIGEKNEK